PFTGQIEIRGDVVGPARQVAFQRQHAFQALPFAHHLLRFFRIRPEIGIRRLLFDFGKLLAQLTGVKDTPGGREPWSLKKCIAVPVHPTLLLTRLILIPLKARDWEAQTAPAARLLKLSHKDMRTNRHAGCRTWYSKPAHTAQSARFAACAEPVPPLFPPDRSPPSVQYWS